jgi:predicted ATPase/DNA-binding CsgD family transcriptional regulator
MSLITPLEPNSNQPVSLVARAGWQRDTLASALPLPLTPLVGRAGEAASVAVLLRDEQVRLLTLTGPSGVGKTRLALHVAEQVADAFPDGIVFVSLASISEPALVLPTIAQALNVRDVGGQPLSERIWHALHNRQLLLVLDNFEHVISAAPDLSELFAAGPAVKVLVTSRIVLRLTGEYEFSLPPLTTPDWQARGDLSSLAQNEAVSLLVQRARAVRPSFSLDTANAAAVAEICTRLDGLPLAIELAAARIKVLSPAALLVRLTDRLQILTGGPRDQPPRLQTMQDAIAWSYDLLAPEEQILFRRLGVFAGGFSLSAAEAVSREVGEAGRRGGAEHDPSPRTRHLTPDTPDPSPDTSPPSVLDTLASLVDKSLLRPADEVGDEPRFVMLETVREFALGKVTEHGQLDEVRRSHAVYFLRFTEEYPLAVSGSGQLARINLYAADHDNFRAAHAWMATTGEWEMCLQFSQALAPYWYLVGNLREGLGWLEQALRHAEGREDRVMAAALLRSGRLGAELGRYEESQTWLETAKRLFSDHNDVAGRAAVFVNLGLIAEKQGDDQRAFDLFAESLPLYRAIGDQRGVGHSLINLADAAYRIGDRQRSSAYAAEGIALGREIEDPFFVAMSLGNLGQLALAQRDTDQARTLFHEMLIECRDIHHPLGVADGVAAMAAIALADGKLAVAARLLGAAQAQVTAIGAQMTPHYGLFNQVTAAVRSHLGDEQFADAWKEGAALSVEQAVAEAAALVQPPPAFPAAVQTEAERFGLTAREMEVLHLLAAGRSDREIGAALFISWRTAQGHVARICGKLGVSTRAAAVSAALRQGLVTVEQIPPA